MSTPILNTRRRSLAMDRTGQWVFSQDIPTDIIVQIGESIFPLHKFMLVAKSNYIRQLVLDSADTDLTRIDLTYLPGGPETFEKVVKFCYCVNFEITVQNVAALRCAAEYLQMTDECCPGNLANRTEDFINQAALTTLSGAIVVLKSCEDDLLLPVAQTLRLVQRCADVISSKACSEATFPSRKPLNWWTEDLSILNLSSFQNVIASMKSRPTKTIIIASAIIAYAERSLRDLVRDHSGNGVATSYSIDSDLRVQQKEHLEAIVALFPQDKSAFPIGFLCSLLRCAIFLKASDLCKKELEKRVSALLEHATVDDLLVLSYTYDGESLFDLESVRRIVSGFVTREISMVDDVFSGAGGSFRGGAETKNTICSAAIQRVAKTIDAYLGEIATYADLSISKFNGIANLVPKGSRRVEDDLYRAIDIYLKAHPNLDEIEREKVCSSMDPLKLSYEARVHASQNKRLPVQIVLHALYYDQLKIRSGANEVAAAAGDTRDQSLNLDSAAAVRGRVTADSSLVRENEVLKSELMKMKMYISDHLERNPGGSSTSYSKNSGGGGGGGVSTSQKKGTFFTTMSKKLGKLNPFRHGSKDTTNIDDGGVDITKPRRRRFSIS